MAVRSISYFLFLLITLSISGCGGGDSSPDIEEVPDVVVEAVEPRDWWDVDAPDYTQTPERPSIELVGSNIIRLQVGENYEELGALATDNQDGDITASINIQGEVDTDAVGDYFVRYSVVDSDDNQGIDQTRLVRVVGEEQVDFSLRPLGDFQVNLGYVEYLPPDYGIDPEEPFPLLIYHHGNGANAEFAATQFEMGGTEGALETVLFNFGPPTIQMAGRWDPELPFIVLTPQAGTVIGSDPAERVQVFIEHAMLTYNIDPTRIYMMGWSQGGGVTVNYARSFPDTLAAMISLSAGVGETPELPEDFCNAEDVPLWIFHGEIDTVVPVENSIRLFDQLEDNCQMTTTPVFTTFPLEDHFVHHFVSDLSAIQGGRFEYQVNPERDAFDVSIYEWLLTFTNQR